LSPPRLPIPPSRQLKFITHTHISLHTTFPAYCKIKIFPAYRMRDLRESCAYSQFRYFDKLNTGISAIVAVNNHTACLSKISNVVRGPVNCQMYGVNNAPRNHYPTADLSLPDLIGQSSESWFMVNCEDLSLIYPKRAKARFQNH
jgi:hypothetical protein